MIDVVNQILLILHFFGLGAAFAAGAGNAAVASQLQRSPGDAPILSRMQPTFVLTGQIGLGLLWLTGLIMVWTRWSGPGSLPGTFWVKFGLVVVLTAVVIYVTILSNRARAGDEAAKRQLPMVAPFSGILLVLVVIFAVMAFN
jgi:hypothetical protein